MIETLQITKITASDLHELENIGRQTFIESYGDRNTAENMESYLSENFNTHRLKSQLADPDSEFYFAILNERVVGYLKLNFGKAQTEKKYPNSVEIERIYVLKEFHGKKIGQLFCNKAFQLGQQYKLSYIWLGVWAENHKAISFYKKYGFTDFDTHTFKFGNDEQQDIIMKLEL